jgi:hypothetical protein
MANRGFIMDEELPGSLGTHCLMRLFGITLDHDDTICNAVPHEAITKRSLPLLANLDFSK